MGMCVPCICNRSIDRAHGEQTTRLKKVLSKVIFVIAFPLYYNGNFKSMLFSFSPYSLLSMVEGGCLKMRPKRKFRELKTADEEKALLEKSIPKSTRYVTKWSFNIFAHWENARLNKKAANEKQGWTWNGTKSKV